MLHDVDKIKREWKVSEMNTIENHCSKTKRENERDREESWTSSQWGYTGKQMYKHDFRYVRL